VCLVHLTAPLLKVEHHEREEGLIMRIKPTQIL
jgi:hypothetical protein